jgi:hypothetical protein
MSFRNEGHFYFKKILKGEKNMSNFLKENQKEEIRYKSKDGKIILYNPTEEQYEELVGILKNAISMDSTNNVLEIKYIREIFRNLVKGGHFIDDYTDEQLSQEIENGNRKIKILMREITELVQEITDDLFYEYTQQIKIMNNLFNIVSSNQDLETVKNKANKFFKKNKMDIKFEDFMNIQNNPQAIEDLTKKLNIRTK